MDAHDFNHGFMLIPFSRPIFSDSHNIIYATRIPKNQPPLYGNADILMANYI